jgi:hypothetical protein
VKGLSHLETGLPWIPACEFVKKSNLGPAQSQIQAQRRPLEWVSTDKFTNSCAGMTAFGSNDIVIPV